MMDRKQSVVDNIQVKSSQERQHANLKKYIPPQLVEFGSISELTNTGETGSADQLAPGSISG